MQSGKANLLHLKCEHLPFQYNNFGEEKQKVLDLYLVVNSRMKLKPHALDLPNLTFFKVSGNMAYCWYE
jgi:hypothetical protein